MKPADSKKTPESAPFDAADADWKAVMEAFERNSFALPSDPTDAGEAWMFGAAIERPADH